VARGSWQTPLRRLTFGASGADPVLVLAQPLDRESTDWDQLPAQLPGLFNF
jgi:hypothetical protein